MIGGSGTIFDDGIHHIVMSTLTNQDVLDFLKGISGLVKLTLINCYDVSSDMVGWGIAHGRTVTLLESDEV